MTFPSNFDLAGVRNNYLSLINTLQTKTKLLERQDISADTLSNISEDLGVIRSGAFIAAQSGTDLGVDANGNPTIGNLTGTAMLWPGIVIGNETYTVVGANNGILEFGLSAIDGTAIFAAGAGVINSSGIIMTGLYYPLQFNATNSGVTRIGLNGMFLPSNSSVPAYEFAYQSSTGSNLVVNGDAETGSLSSWTDILGSVWAVTTSSPYQGTYSFFYQFSQSSNIVVNGNAETGNTSGWTDASSAWTATTSTPFDGTYSFRHSPTNAGCPAQLVQNVTVSVQTYDLYFYSKRNSGAFTPHINLVWKNGATILSTTRVNGTTSSSWSLSHVVVTPPASTNNCSILLDAGDTFTDAQFDDIVFTAHNAYLSQNITVTPNQKYLFSCAYRTVSGVSAPYFTVQWQTSGGAFISNAVFSPIQSSTWTTFQQAVVAPATAGIGRILLHPGDVLSNTTQYDIVFLGTQSVSNSLYFMDNALRLEGSPMEFLSMSPSVSPVSGYGDIFFNSTDGRPYAITSDSTRWPLYSLFAQAIEPWSIKPGTAGASWGLEAGTGASITACTWGRLDLQTGATSGTIIDVFADNSLLSLQPGLLFQVFPTPESPLTNSTVYTGVWADATAHSSTALPALTAAHIGFKIINGAVFATSCDGTHAENSTNSGITLVQGNPIRLSFAFVSSSLVNFYYNGSLVAQHATNLPSPRGLSLHYIGTQTNAAANQWWLFGPLVIQEAALL